MIEVALVAAAYLAARCRSATGSCASSATRISVRSARRAWHDECLAQLRLALRRGTLLLDVAKGAVPALAALHWSGPLTASIAGIVAMLGHGYPVLLGFGGGKGVATGAGAALALFPAGVGIAALAFAVVFFGLRYVSLASLASGMAFLIAAIALGRDWPVIAFAALAFGFVAYRHRANIARLRAGTEPRARLRRRLNPAS